MPFLSTPIQFLQDALPMSAVEKVAHISPHNAAMP